MLNRQVIKAGHILVDDTEICQAVFGRTLTASPIYDLQRDSQIEACFNENYSLSVRSFGAAGDELRLRESF